MAARNNADWYSMMFDIHGLAYCRSAEAFLALDTPPPYHSWITTLDPEATEQQLQLIRQNSQQPDFAVKDAFGKLKLASEHLVEYFSASWIFADSKRLPTNPTPGWSQVHLPADLLCWETAWKAGGSPSSQRQFPDAILQRTDVQVWGRCSADSASGYDAGVVANLSADCVGLSNCFGHRAFAAAAALCADMADRKLPVVGYELGEDLSIALDHGFSAVGTLRLWGSAAGE